MPQGPWQPQRPACPRTVTRQNKTELFIPRAAQEDIWEGEGGNPGSRQQNGSERHLLKLVLPAAKIDFKLQSLEERRACATQSAFERRAAFVFFKIPAPLPERASFVWLPRFAKKKGRFTSI